jgi:hypothetical protein
MAVVLGADLPQRRAYVDAMAAAADAIRTATPPGADAVHVTRMLASALRTTIAAGLVGELPITSLQAYADSIVLGERERRQLGIVTATPE